MLQVSIVISTVSGIVIIGFLSASAFYVRENHGVIKDRELLTYVPPLSILWALSQLAVINATLASILDTTFIHSIDLISLRSFVTQTTLGKVLFYEFLGALCVALCSSFIRKTGGILGLLIVAMISLVFPLFQSHGSQSRFHGLAIGAIIFHVSALALWMGGVVAMLFISDRVVALPRFSTVALWTSIIVGVSGVANAYTRLNFLSAWNSLYSLLVVLKIVLFALLILVGARHRTHIAHLIEENAVKKDAETKVKLANSRDDRTHTATSNLAIYRLLIGELVLMVSTVAVGVVLARTTPPTAPLSDDGKIDPALALTGVPMVAPPTFSRVFMSYEPDGIILGLLILSTALYIRGVIVLSKRGIRWPIGRTISFALGISMIDFATSGGLGVYSHFSFSWHMVAHMVLSMIAPIGIVLGAPLTLALRTLPAGRTPEERGLRGFLVAILHSRYIKVMTHPIVALAIFDGSLFALYMTRLFGNLMTGHLGHVVMDIHFVLAGALFFHVIVGIDPNPRKVPYLVKIVMLFAAMSIHAFFSLSLLSMTTLLDHGYFYALQRPWWSDLLADQKLGSSLGWAIGEIPIVLALIATFIQWVRDDTREEQRIERKSRIDRAAGREDEHDAYNRYLEMLAHRTRDEELREKE